MELQNRLNPKSRASFPFATICSGVNLLGNFWGSVCYVCLFLDKLQPTLSCLIFRWKSCYLWTIPDVSPEILLLPIFHLYHSWYLDVRSNFGERKNSLLTVSRHGARPKTAWADYNLHGVRTIALLQSKLGMIWQVSEQWKKPWLFTVYRGWDPTQWYRAYNKPL